MAFIANIFWNPEQRRLRALWRLLIWGVVWFTLLITIQAIIGVAAVIIGFATGMLTAEQLSNPMLISEQLMEQSWILVAAEIAQFVVTVGAVWLAGRFLDRRKFVDFGLHLNKDWWIDFGFGLLLGAILMAIIFGMEVVTGWITITRTFVAPQGNAFAIAILGALFTFILVGINEELFSRGYQLTNMAEGFNWKLLGPRWAIVIATLLSSAIFGLLHLGNPNATAISTFNIFLAGILLAVGYLLTGELAIPIGLHISWNFFQGNVFGFPVSGISSNQTTFIGIEQGGPDLWTGGAFGPEAGLLGVGAMALGVILTILWIYLRRGKVALHLPLAEAPTLPAQVAGDVESVIEARS
ncbi:MAG: CPBP family intramembrane metalloprotease [Anaerolineae bacterium]|nr:CPBP family intramembrane metalloprotease [Anaerolineae bacterium]